MKPSGIEWIGDIPDDWEVTKIGQLYLERNEKVSDREYEALSVTKHGILKQLESAAKTDNGDNRKLVKSGDFVINSRSDRRGSCGISKFDGSVSLINIILMPTQKIANGYYNYLFRTENFADEFYKYGNGIVDDLWSTKWTSMKKILVPFPSLRTQQRIADYLDEKCGEIDATIAKQKESIEKLKAYKQSLISETVTKGLDKSAPLKPSGIEWIGDIPSHWEIKKLKFLVSLIDNKTKDGHSISLENIESGTGKLIETENTYDGEGISFKENDLLFGKLRPYLAKVYLSALKGRALGDFYVMRANKGTNPNFLKFVLLSDWFIKIVDSSTYGTKMPRASWDFTGGMRIPLPPISEQDCISSYLETKCSEVDTFIIEKQNIIQKLDAYKKSLIFECVTGKCSILGEICNGRKSK